MPLTNAYQCGHPPKIGHFVCIILFGIFVVQPTGCIAQLPLLYEQFLYSGNHANTAMDINLTMNTPLRIKRVQTFSALFDLISKKK